MGLLWSCLPLLISLKVFAAGPMPLPIVVPVPYCPTDAWKRVHVKLSVYLTVLPPPAVASQSTMLLLNLPW